MVLCKILSSGFVGASFEAAKTSPCPPSKGEWNSRQKRFKNPNTPLIPLVFQGLLCSKGPRNISYNRNVSAPKSLQMSSGVTTFHFDLDIFSTSQPQI